MLKMFPKKSPGSRDHRDQSASSRRRSRQYTPGSVGDNFDLKALEKRITPAVDLSGVSSLAGVVADTSVVSTSTTTTVTSPPTSDDPNALSSTATIVTVAAIDGSRIPAPVIPPFVPPPGILNPPPPAFDPDWPVGHDWLPLQLAPPGALWNTTTSSTTTTSSGTIVAGSTSILYTSTMTTITTLTSTGAFYGVNVITTMTNAAGDPIGSISVTMSPGGQLSSTVMTLTDPTDPSGGFSITTTQPVGSVSLPNAPMNGYPAGATITTVSTSTPVGSWGPGAIYETTIITTIAGPDGTPIVSGTSTPVSPN